jgi:hypothetical protein
MRATCCAPCRASRPTDSSASVCHVSGRQNNRVSARSMAARGTATLALTSKASTIDAVTAA